MVFEVGIGASQEWDSEKAVEEAMTEAKLSLNNEPSCVMFFSTIHYEKNNGFRKAINKIYSSVREETRLVGGTLTGFATKQGCFTRGLLLVLLYSDEIEFAVGFGKHTKRNPKVAVSHCAKQIKKNLDKKYSNNFIFENTSNGTIPKIPFIGQKKVLKIPFSDLIMPAFNILNTTLEYGVGREDEVLEELSKKFEDSKIIAVANYDDFKAFSNYQFINKEILQNSVTVLAINTDLEVSMNSTLGLYETDTTLKISKKNLHGCSFGKIDDKNATSELFSKLGWDNSFLNEQIYRKTNYYPIGYLEHGTISAHVVGLVIGNNLCYTHRFKQDELKLYTTSGKALLDDTKKNLASFEHLTDIKLGIIVECAIRLETLGRNINKIQKEVSSFFKDKPFFILYGAGEGTYEPNKGSRYFNLSFNTAIIHGDKK